MLPLLALAASGCAAAGETRLYPSADVNSVEIAAASLDAVTIEFAIEVRNPYTVALPVTGLEYELSSRDRRFAEGDVALERQVPAGGSAEIKVPARVPYTAIYEVLRDFGVSRTLPYHADLGIELTAPAVGAITLPLDVDGELRIPGS